MLRVTKEKRWYKDRQNIALITGFISTIVTLLNFWISVN